MNPDATVVHTGARCPPWSCQGEAVRPFGRGVTACSSLPAAIPVSLDPGPAPVQQADLQHVRNPAGAGTSRSGRTASSQASRAYVEPDGSGLGADLAAGYG